MAGVANEGIVMLLKHMETANQDVRLFILCGMSSFP